MSYFAKYLRAILGGQGWFSSTHFSTRRALSESNQRPNEHPWHGRLPLWLGRLQASLAFPPLQLLCYLGITWASCYKSIQCIIFCKMLHIHFTGPFLSKSLSREGRELRRIQAQHPCLSYKVSPSEGSLLMRDQVHLLNEGWCYSASLTSIFFFKQLYWDIMHIPYNSPVYLFVYF